MNIYGINRSFICLCKCSKCGGDALVDDTMVLTSNPPQFNYECMDCGNRDSILTSETRYYEEKKLSVEIKEKIKKLVEEYSKLKNEAKIMPKPKKKRGC